MQLAQRIKPLQTNVFADMDEAKAIATQSGKEIIDLSLGSSDLPAPKTAIAAIENSLHDPSTHGYTLFHSTRSFREAVARWYQRKYGQKVDPETEVLPLIGCQEGTAHLPLAVLNPGDYALLQDPGYPSHAGGVYLAGGQIYRMPLFAERDFLPDFSVIPPEIVQQARMMVLSYPHNPTTAIAPLEFFQEAVTFCKKNNLVLVHDFPYADVVFEGSPPSPSIFQADTQKEIAIEFYTFSKSYNMGGFRIAYAIGNPQLIRALRQVKAIVDFNQYRGILNGGIAALEGDQSIINDIIQTFQKRRDAAVTALRHIGWPVATPKATMYIWAKLREPWHNKSNQFCVELVKATGVALAPGAGFGESGEGYVRIALVRDEAVLETAIARMAAFLKSA
ncbi:LL-diaminopimelate aminotransferase [Spirulina sp. CS-785/01]|uniref:LL-diaminopimelate aminotransferase n=1 Tax=Spirulina sp. CS-785/01 TaxID=3021716 RepID=UPI00232CEEF4|nr:LL-diaminopimelate aminotransferase [Spirulina sp. CS-785/01]MDB9313583.1 LL-diaminopimelate aminotransferase [Spirulina sp. CS-785/01]